MAGGKLEVQIGADITDFEKKIKEVEFDIKELSKVKLDRLKVGLDTTEINAQIKDAKNSLNQLKTTVKDTGSQIGGQFTKQVGNGGNTLMQFSRIAQDAPFGIMGIGNNITATAESFSYLKQQTGSTGGALKALASSIAGTGGILLGVSLLTTGLTLLSQSGLSVSDVIDKITGNTNTYADALKKVTTDAYKSENVIKAIEDVNQLTNEVKLAKEGFISKDKVVEHYNETMGKTAGIVKTVDEVEQQLVKNGDAYIKMMLYKAVATLAQAEAAKELLNKEKLSKSETKDHLGVLGNLMTMLAGTGLNYQAYSNAEKTRTEAIKGSTKAMEASLSIADKYNKMAAEIAKKNNFNFFSDNATVKAPKPQVRNTIPFQNSIIPAPLFDVNGIAVFNGQVDKFGNKIKVLPGIIKASMLQATAAADEGMVLFNARWTQFGKDFSAILEGGIETSLIGFGDALGSALVNGLSVLEALGASLLSSIGNTIKAVGMELVKMGVLAQAYAAVVEWMKKVFANPYALAAAGVVLVAIGAAVSASASRVASGGGSGGGRASGGSGAGANNSSFTSSGFSGNNGGGTVVFEIAGTKLIGVLSNTINANRRLGGAIGLG